MRSRKLLLAQPDQQLGNGNAHRAHLPAGSAQRRGRGQPTGCLHAQQMRRHDLADGPRIGRAIGMAADAGIDGAVVHAGTAADALQRGSQLLIGVGLRASVVQQHEVHLGRPVLFARATRTGDHVEIRRDVLPRGRTGEQRVERRHMVEPLHHLLDARHGNVHRWNRGAHAAVALVLHQTQRAGLGHREVHPRQPDVRLQELLPQHAPPDLDERVHTVGVVNPRNPLGKQPGNLLARLVNGGHDDVRRLLASELHDVLAHVRLQRIHASSLRRMVELDLLAHHRLALDHVPRSVRPADVQNDARRFLRRGSPVHPHPIARERLLQLHQQIGQPGQVVLANALAQYPQTLQLLRIGKLGRTLGHQKIHRPPEALAQLRMGHHGPRPLAKPCCGMKLQHLLGRRRACRHAPAPFASVSVSAAHTSTTSSRGPCAP